MSTPQGPHGTPRHRDDADTPQAPDEPDWGTPPAGGWGGAWSPEPQPGQGWGSGGRDRGEQAGYGQPQHGPQYGGEQRGQAQQYGQYDQPRYDQPRYGQPQQAGYGSYHGEQQYGDQPSGDQPDGNRPQDGAGGQGWSGHRQGAEQSWSPSGGPDQGWDPAGSHQGDNPSQTQGWHEDQARSGDRGWDDAGPSPYGGRAGEPAGGGDPGREQPGGTPRAPEQQWDRAGEQGWSPEHGTRGRPDEQAWAGQQGMPGQQGLPGQQGGDAPAPQAWDPGEAQRGSRGGPKGGSGRSPLPFIIGGVALVLVVAAAVVLFVTPGYLTTRNFDQGALNQGVARILQQDYKLGATDVNCPSGVEVTAGDTFSCDAKVDGEAVKVPVTILDEDGTYQVGRV
jgi:hypothetical protein